MYQTVTCLNVYPELFALFQLSNSSQSGIIPCALHIVISTISIQNMLLLGALKSIPNVQDIKYNNLTIRMSGNRFYLGDNKKLLSSCRRTLNFVNWQIVQRLDNYLLVVETMFKNYSENTYSCLFKVKLSVPEFNL